MICNTDADSRIATDLIFVWISTNEKTNIENDYLRCIAASYKSNDMGILCNALQAYPSNIINS